MLRSLLQPYTALVVSLVAATWYVWWRQARPRRLWTAVPPLLATLLYVLSTPAAGYLSQGTLEWHYQPLGEPPTSGDTIVVLSGSMVVDDPATGHAIAGPDTIYRCLGAASLYKSAGECRVIVSGGRVDRSWEGSTLADTMREFLIEAGVDEGYIIREDQSSTTYENALNVAEIVGRSRSGRVFLVTSASHMLRAEGCFRRRGIDVVPAICDRHAVELDASPTSFLPSLGGMRGFERAFHEWLGLAWYKLRDRM